MFLLLSLIFYVSAQTCTERCIAAGHCCTGGTSACANPSCEHGCIIGAGSNSEASCNATCAAAKGCSFSFQGKTYNMCGDCSQRWLDPDTLTPKILPGNEPFWPPGWELGSCSSCDDRKDECMLGCVLEFNPSYNPGPPPSPTPPPPSPMPPPPWPNPTSGFNFSGTLSSHMVLQQSPAISAVYGNTGDLDNGAVVKVSVTPSSGSPYTVTATVNNGRWKAFLKPHPDDSRATTYTITAMYKAAQVSLEDVVFGDVYYCAGQVRICALRVCPLPLIARHSLTLNIITLFPP